jgi:hypothetical protein
MKGKEGGRERSPGRGCRGLWGRLTGLSRRFQRIVVGGGVDQSERGRGPGSPLRRGAGNGCPQNDCLSRGPRPFWEWHPVGPNLRALDCGSLLPLLSMQPAARRAEGGITVMGEPARTVRQQAANGRKRQQAARIPKALPDFTSPGAT